MNAFADIFERMLLVHDVYDENQERQDYPVYDLHL